jgi:hypothetical protein
MLNAVRKTLFTSLSNFVMAKKSLKDGLRTPDYSHRRHWPWELENGEILDRGLLKWEDELFPLSCVPPRRGYVKGKALVIHMKAGRCGSLFD